MAHLCVGYREGYYWLPTSRVSAMFVEECGLTHLIVQNKLTLPLTLGRPARQVTFEFDVVPGGWNLQHHVILLGADFLYYFNCKFVFNNFPAMILNTAGEPQQKQNYICLNYTFVTYHNTEKNTWRGTARLCPGYTISSINKNIA